MMKTGICRICGYNGPLSFEHIPPQKAFNDGPVMVSKFKDVINKGPGEQIKGKELQRGIGEYSLCIKCNNNTGAWYGSDFVKWCFQGNEILLLCGGKPNLCYGHKLYPLRIIKQIITMFFTVNQEGFSGANQYLVEFILNKEKQYLPENYRIFIYYNCKGNYRNTGIVVRGSAKGQHPFSNKPIYFSEFNYPPFGYVFSYDGSEPDNRLYEITYFAKYSYSDERIFYLDLPILPTHLWVPSDYRTEKEIWNDYLKNMKEEEDKIGYFH